MRIARFGAFTFTAVCLVVAAVSLLLPAKYTVCVGGDCTTVSCGSPAFPKEAVDFAPIGDASNCAGMPSATIALGGVILAGLGLGAITITSRRGTSRRGQSSTCTPKG